MQWGRRNQTGHLNQIIFHATSQSNKVLKEAAGLKNEQVKLVQQRLQPVADLLPIVYQDVDLLTNFFYINCLWENPVP